jgi:hypothetical protein
VRVILGATIVGDDLPINIKHLGYHLRQFRSGNSAEIRESRDVLVLLCVKISVLLLIYLMLGLIAEHGWLRALLQAVIDSSGFPSVPVDGRNGDSNEIICV